MTQPVHVVRFTEVARRAMRWAHEDGVASNQHYIEPLHLLLGIAREADGIGYRLLQIASIDGPAVRRVVEQQVPPKSPKRSQRAVELGQQTKRVLEVASRQVQQQEQPELSTAHLLLGVLSVNDEPVTRALHALGVDLDELRRAAEAAQNELE